MRDFDVGYRAILRDYFGIDGRPPVYSDKDFERRFRVPRSVFNCIYEAIKDEPFWSRRINATGQPQAYPLQKLVAAFRVLAYGETYDRSDEYTRLSRSTVAVATTKLVDFIVHEYAPMYLRPPNDAELAHILHRNAQRGMPGCIGSIDCSHWPWRQCPRGQAGQYQDYKGRRSVTMETVCDEDLYNWHFFIGCAGSNNDLIVIRQSPLYHSIMSGTWPPDRFEYVVKGRSRRLLYYLADGIYPQYAVFARPYGTAITPQQRTYNRLQEALRKDVERVFAVMTNRFHIALYPARFSTVTRLIATGRAIAILHNMIIRERWDGFLKRRRIAAVGGVPAAVPLGTPGAAVGAGSAAAGNVGPAGGVAVPGCGADGERGDAGGVGVAKGEGGPLGGVAAAGAAGTAAGAGGPAGGLAGAGEAAAGETVGGQHRLPVGVLASHGHPPVAIIPASAPPEGWFARSLVARAAATSTLDHQALCYDLAAHIWKERKTFLAPYL